MRLLMALKFFLCFALIMPLSLHAVDKDVKFRARTGAAPGEYKWAVVIGVSQYDDEAILDLKYAVADAKSVYDLLIDKQYGGFEAGKVKLLMDAEATRNDILKALTGIENVADENDTVFIFFSGHGIEESEVSYFLPADADMAILRDTGIPMKRFTDTLDRTKAKVQVMFFDACHSGARKDKSMSGQLSEKQFSRIFTDVDGRAVLSSCDADEVSYEHPDAGVKHGVFTYYLIEALTGNADSNADGFVTVSEASKYVMENVKEWAFQTGKKQNPRLDYNVSGEIILTLASGQIKRAVERIEPEVEYVTPSTTKPRTIDGAEMVLIPAGEFSMGSNDGYDDEKPVHPVYVDAFYMDRYEVTNKLYKKFMDSTGHKVPSYWDRSDFNAPDFSQW